MQIFFVEQIYKSDGSRTKSLQTHVLKREYQDKYGIYA